MLDAGYWYNRNLVIIANIERQFLDKSDLKDIYFYWGKHRSVKNKMITHIRIQAVLGSALASLVLAFHFFTRVWDGLWEPLSAFDPVRMLPYLASLTMLALCVHLKRDRDAAYANFRTNSPGIDVDTSGIVFGTGHTVDK